MKKLLIFDLDGTLLDTLADLQESVNFALRQFGFPEKDLEHVRKSIGNGVAKLMERCTPKGTANPHYFACLDIFKKHYSEHYADKTLPYQGMSEIVMKLKGLGYKTAVATNKIDRLAKELIEAHFPGCFDFVLGDKDGVPKKPYPDMINHILEYFNMTNDEAFYIGDTNVDEETAINSKLDYVLVTYGYRTKEEIKNTCTCKILLDSPSEVFQFFNNLIN